MRKQRITLENHPELSLMHRYIRHVFPVEEEFPAVLLQKSRNNAQRRRLSAAARAKQRNQLPFLYFQVEIFQNMVLFVVNHVDFFQRNKSHIVLSFPIPRYFPISRL